MSQALFPAWRPTDGEAARLAPVAAALREASREHGLRLGSLRRPDQWHVTLCFVGNGVRHLATPALRASFERVAACMPPHSFRFERIMYWPKGVVVALPSECLELQALCDATRDAIRRCGISPAQVTTQPHLTLAYAGKGLPRQDWLGDIDCSEAGTFHVDRFELLFNPGGRYDALGSWALTGAGLPRPPEQGVLL